jgi:dTMP kinase
MGMFSEITEETLDEVYEELYPNIYEDNYLKISEKDTEEKPEKGYFITFEGKDASGKSYLTDCLYDYLRDEMGYKVIKTLEPGGTDLGNMLRYALLNGSLDRSKKAEALMYAASRAEHVEKVIRPALENGTIVLCDRYIDSSLAYQGVGRNLGVETILKLNNWATDSLMPDITFLIKGEIKKNKELDTLEADKTLQSIVPKGYEEIVKLFPNRINVIDNSKMDETSLNEIIEKVTELLENKKVETRNAVAV